MSMTREEAIELLCYGDWLNVISEHIGKQDTERIAEAMSIVGKALRPVTREQVEKVWPGCDFCKIELDDYPYIVAHSDYSSSDTFYEPSFCPICGKPLTDEAVETIMKRMEEMRND